MNLIGTNADEFEINPDLPMVMDADSIFLLPIRFKPKSIGTKTAQIEIKSNANENSELNFDITARKDSVLLIPELINIALGKLFPNQTKDTITSIINTGSIETVGFAKLSENLSADETNFSINESDTYQFDFTFKGLPTEGLFNEMITISDTICHNEREVMISGEIVSTTINGFTETQCVSEEHEYSIILPNPSDNELTITDVLFDDIDGKFRFDTSLLPIAVTENTEIPITFTSDETGTFKTEVICKTDNELVTELNANVSVDVIKFKRTHSSYINDKVRSLTNPYPITIDTTSDYGTRNFIYSIRMHKKDEDVTELVAADTLNITVDFESNFIAPMLETLELGSSMTVYQIIEKKEYKVDEMNSQLIIKLAKTNDIEINSGEYELFNIEFTLFLSRNGVEDDLTAEIKHTITSNYACLDYETEMNSAVLLENQCIDDIYVIKHGDEFYFNEITPNPIDRNEIKIEYGIAFDCHVIIKIYDTSGKLISTPVNENQTQGDYQKSLSAEGLMSGSYFIEVEASSFKVSRKFIVE